MGKTKTTDVIALSIKPIYANAILSGQKTVEFRKIGVPDSVKSISLYSTAPEQKIVGYFDVKYCETASPFVLWKKYGENGYIDFDSFNQYYQNKDMGKCFVIGKVYQFKNPVPLANCKSFSKSPQSFAYILKSEWKNLKRRAVL